MCKKNFKMVSQKTNTSILRKFFSSEHLHICILIALNSNHDQISAQIKCVEEKGGLWDMGQIGIAFFSGYSWEKIMKKMLEDCTSIAYYHMCFTSDRKTSSIQGERLYFGCLKVNFQSHIVI